MAKYKYQQNLTDVYDKVAEEIGIPQEHIAFLFKSNPNNSEVLSYIERSSIAPENYRFLRTQAEAEFIHLTGTPSDEFQTRQISRLQDSIRIHWAVRPYLTDEEAVICDALTWDKSHASPHRLAQILYPEIEELTIKDTQRAREISHRVSSIIREYCVVKGIDAPKPFSFIEHDNIEGKAFSKRFEEISGDGAFFYPYINNLKNNPFSNDISQIGLGNFTKVLALTLGAGILPPKMYGNFRDIIVSGDSVQFQDLLKTDAYSAFTQAFHSYVDRSESQDVVISPRTNDFTIAAQREPLPSREIQEQDHPQAEASPIIKSNPLQQNLDELISHHLPIIQEFHNCGMNALPPLHYLCFAMPRLVRSEHKQWISGLIDMTGLKKKTIQTYYYEAKTMLTQHFEDMGSSLAQHPFLTATVMPTSLNAFVGVQQVTSSDIRNDDPDTLLIFRYADTLFEKDDLYVFSMQYLKPFNERMTIQEIADSSGITERNVSMKTNLLRDRMRTFLDGDRRTAPLAQNAIFKGVKERQNDTYADYIQCENIVMDTPALSQIFTSAEECLNGKQKALLYPVLFYPPEERQKFADVAGRMNLTENSASIYSQKARKILKEALHAVMPGLEKHPILRKRKVNMLDPEQFEIPEDGLVQDDGAEAKRLLARNIFTGNDYQIFISGEPDVVQQAHLLSNKNLSDDLDLSEIVIRDKRKNLSKIYQQAHDIDIEFATQRRATKEPQAPQSLQPS